MPDSCTPTRLVPADPQGHSWTHFSITSSLVPHWYWINEQIGWTPLTLTVVVLCCQLIARWKSFQLSFWDSWLKEAGSGILWTIYPSLTFRFRSLVSLSEGYAQRSGRYLRWIGPIHRRLIYCQSSEWRLSIKRYTSMQDAYVLFSR